MRLMGTKRIDLPIAIKKPVLAFGAQTKNTICFAEGSLAYVSHSRTDLNSPRDFWDFTKSAQSFLKRKPQIIAYDLHPGYQSTRYALSLASKTYDLAPIQHHHAHIASCMADNGLKNQKVISVAFDGTGLGSDNTIWGAEFLLCDYCNYQRVGHLGEVPLLGGEKAITEPWRLATFWLHSLYGERFLKLDIDFIRKIDIKKWQVLKKMQARHFNAPLASSMGRLFDAAASLILKKYKAAFEAELAMALEKEAGRFQGKSSGYPFKIQRIGGTCIINAGPLFRQIVSDLKAKEGKEKMAYRFHLAVAQMIIKVCLILRRQYNIEKIVLSGGVFQNNLLLTLSSHLLDKHGFKVFAPKNLSCSDSGISLGQAVIAGWRGESDVFRDSHEGKKDLR